MHVSINCHEHVIRNNVFYILRKITLKLILPSASQSVISVALLPHHRLPAPISSVHSFSAKSVTKERGVHTTPLLHARQHLKIPK